MPAGLIIKKFSELNLKKKEIIKQKDKKVEPEFEKIYNILSYEQQMHINEIVKTTHMQISEINYKLMMLELQEKIVSLPGNNYKKL